MPDNEVNDTAPAEPGAKPSMHAGDVNEVRGMATLSASCGRRHALGMTCSGCADVLHLRRATAPPVRSKYSSRMAWRWPAVKGSDTLLFLGEWGIQSLMTTAPSTHRRHPSSDSTMRV